MPHRTPILPLLPWRRSANLLSFGIEQEDLVLPSPTQGLSVTSLGDAPQNGGSEGEGESGDEDESGGEDEVVPASASRKRGRPSRSATGTPVRPSAKATPRSSRSAASATPVSATLAAGQKRKSSEAEVVATPSLPKRRGRPAATVASARLAAKASSETKTRGASKRGAAAVSFFFLP